MVLFSGSEADGGGVCFGIVLGGVVVFAGLLFLDEIRGGLAVLGAGGVV